VLQPARLLEPAGDPPPAGRWLVQAKLTLRGWFPNLGNTCGLVQSDTTIIDEVRYIGEGFGQEDGSNPQDAPTSERIALTAILATAPDVDSTTIAVRCTEASGLGFHVDWDSGKLTAFEVKAEAQTN
jgi:hypothetical protein